MLRIGKSRQALQGVFGHKARVLTPAEMTVVSGGGDGDGDASVGRKKRYGTDNMSYKA